MAVQNKIFSVNKTLNVRGHLVEFSQPKIMGILNVTPDSFYSGSRVTDCDAAMRHVEAMVTAGADMVDVGGYSSRPGADEIPETEELKRVVPVIEALRKNFPTLILSIDTFRSEVAEAALYAGADMVNDITGGADERMYAVAAHAHAPYVLMHMRGTPQTMNQLTNYEDLNREMIDFFAFRLEKIRLAGVPDVVLDPGFGFAKTGAQNFNLLGNLERLHVFEKPLLVGLSRKSMIWRTLQTNPDEALTGTIALNTVAVLKGASILRVHDVKPAREVITLMSQL